MRVAPALLAAVVLIAFSAAPAPAAAQAADAAAAARYPDRPVRGLVPWAAAHRRRSGPSAGTDEARGIGAVLLP